MDAGWFDGRKGLHTEGLEDVQQLEQDKNRYSNH